MEVRSTDKENGFESDMIDLVRRLMEDMFIPLFLDEQACQKIGFTHISRLVGEMPGWYLWTKDRKGAFLLELVAIEPMDMTHSISLDRIPELEASFVLRYYPSPDELVFKDYALVERLIRLSPFFDQTGTPRAENWKEIHESLFLVGDLHVFFDRQLSLAIFKVSAQDRWIEIRKNGLAVFDHSGQTIEAVAQGAIDRNIPGWELTWSIIDKFLLGFCYVHKSIPHTRLSRSSGVTWYIYTEDQVEEIQSPDIVQWTLETGILLQSDKNTSTDILHLKKVLHEFFRISSENKIPVGYFEEPPEKEHPWINANWWMSSSWSFPPSEEIKHCCLRDH
jgi:hypothetical protein